MTLQKQDLEYFSHGALENAKFWQRFVENPDFENSLVLDVGCGHGRICIDIAELGAKKVVGLDIDSERIEFAQENLKLNYHQYADIVSFETIDLKDYDADTKFDYIISKDSFEHIIDLDYMLIEMTKNLKKGGRIYIGFAPLYNTPYGDHKRTEAILPWGHLFIPQSILLKRVSKKRGVEIKSIEDLGLNKMSLRQYQELFTNSDLSVVSFKVNCSNNPIMKLFSLLRKIPGLTEFFSYNIYCILQKDY